MSGVERRRHARVALHIPVEIEWGSETLNAEVQDISLGGMFIATPNPLWVGARFASRLRAADPLDLDCVVRRVVPGSGMGVEFERVSPELRARLEAVVSSPQAAPQQAPQSS